MSSTTRPSTSQNRPYQGYPYVNPMVIDVPSIDQATASKWTNLPRRPIAPVRRADDVGVDVCGEGTSRIPEPSYPAIHQPKGPIPVKKEPNDNPVVYIDLPEEGGSGVAQNREDSQENEPSYVQETILYDPFENRMIDLSRGESTRSGESEKSDSNSSVGSRNCETPSRLSPLNIASPGSSRTPINTVSSSSTYVPPFLSKESNVYGIHINQDDGFPLSPIPVSEFPEPPPAYSKYDLVVGPTSPTTVEPPRREIEHPRTQVILPQVSEMNSPIGLPNPNRKFLTCHHCGLSVHTMVIRETGVITHLIAIICFLFCFPVAFVIYFMSVFKNKNHYCPNCNKLIGYEYPIIGQNIIYVNS